MILVERVQEVNAGIVQKLKATREEVIKSLPAQIENVGVASMKGIGVSDVDTMEFGDEVGEAGRMRAVALTKKT